MSDQEPQGRTVWPAPIPVQHQIQSLIATGIPVVAITTYTATGEHTVFMTPEEARGLAVLILEETKKAHATLVRPTSQEVAELNGHPIPPEVPQ